MNSHCHVDVNSYPFNSNIAHIARSLKLSRKIQIQLDGTSHALKGDPLPMGMSGMFLMM